jgi:hypothetical protein
MQALTAYIHANGQKTTIYTDAGALSCSIVPQPGSYGYEQLDVQTFMEWGFDGVKMDWCFVGGLDPQTQGTLFSNAILATGKPMSFDLCEWSIGNPWTWGGYIANTWRTADQGITWDSMLLRFHECAAQCAYTRPGFWGNPGEMTIGYGSMTDKQWEAQFFMHCILAAPMILDTILANLTAPQLAILKNPEAIAVNQDSAGNAGCKVSDDGAGKEVYVKTQANNGEYAAMLLNTAVTGQTITLTYSDFGRSGSAVVRNVGNQSAVGTYSNSYSQYVSATSAVLLKLSFCSGCTATPTATPTRTPPAMTLTPTPTITAVVTVGARVASWVAAEGAPYENTLRNSTWLGQTPMNLNLSGVVAPGFVVNPVFEGTYSMNGFTNCCVNIQSGFLSSIFVYPTMLVEFYYRQAAVDNVTRTAYSLYEPNGGTYWSFFVNAGGQPGMAYGNTQVLGSAGAIQAATWYVVDVVMGASGNFCIINPAAGPYSQTHTLDGSAYAFPDKIFLGQYCQIGRDTKTGDTVCSDCNMDAFSVYRTLPSSYPARQ